MAARVDALREYAHVFNELWLSFRSPQRRLIQLENFEMVGM